LVDLNQLNQILVLDVISNNLTFLAQAGGIFGSSMGQPNQTAQTSGIFGSMSNPSTSGGNLGFGGLSSMIHINKFK